MAETGAGHRTVPHTADVRIEAWGQSGERCVAEAAAAMVGGFADVSEADPTETITLNLDRPADADALVTILEEVIFLLDVRGVVPVRTEVTAEGQGLTTRFSMVSAEEVPLIGAVPKAVSLHELRWERREGGWRCAVTLDV